MTISKNPFLITVDHANNLERDKWIEYLANIVEKSPELAQKIWRSMPYNNVDEIEIAFFKGLDSLNIRDKIKIINRHRNVMQTIIQRFIKFKADINSGAVIKFLDINEFELQLCKGIYLLKAYEKHFGFPFVMKPTEINFEDFYLALQIRCNNTLEQEIKIAMDEIKKFSSEKLKNVINSPKKYNVFK